MFICFAIVYLRHFNLKCVHCRYGLDRSICYNCCDGPDYCNALHNDPNWGKPPPDQDTTTTNSPLQTSDLPNKISPTNVINIKNNKPNPDVQSKTQGTWTEETTKISTTENKISDTPTNENTVTSATTNVVTNSEVLANTMSSKIKVTDVNLVTSSATTTQKFEKKTTAVNSVSSTKENQVDTEKSGVQSTTAKQKRSNLATNKPGQEIKIQEKQNQYHTLFR